MDILWSVTRIELRKNIRFRLVDLFSVLLRTWKGRQVDVVDDELVNSVTDTLLSWPKHFAQRGFDFFIRYVKLSLYSQTRLLDHGADPPTIRFYSGGVEDGPERIEAMMTRFRGIYDRLVECLPDVFERDVFVLRFGLGRRGETLVRAVTRRHPGTNITDCYRAMRSALIKMQDCYGWIEVER